MPIKVNNVEITDEEVFQEMQYQTDASNVEEVIFKAAQALVVQQLLLQKANIEKGCDDEELKINQLLEAQINIPTADTKSCRRYYDSNKVKFFDKELDKTLPFDMVEAHIKEYLQNQSTTSGISEYIQMLSVNADIKGFDFKDPSTMNIKTQ